jgi:hypothetical protein
MLTARRDTVAVLAMLVLVALWNSVSRADASFCPCGYTSKEVRGWSNHYLATPAGQARLSTALL